MDECPDYEGVGDYIRSIVETIPAGKLASGPDADLIRRVVLPSPVGENVAIRKSRLRDELRK